MQCRSVLTSKIQHVVSKNGAHLQQCTEFHSVEANPGWAPPTSGSNMFGVGARVV